MENIATICLYLGIQDVELITIEKRVFLLRNNFLIILFNFIFCCYVFTISLNTEVFNELQNKILKLKAYKEELLNALGEFLEEHFPLPEKCGSARTKVRFP